MPYELYIDFDCVAMFSDWDDAKKAYNIAVIEYPESAIDLLSPDGEINYSELIQKN